MDRRKLLQSSGWVAGGAIVAPSLMTMLQSCQEIPRLDWEPLSLNHDEARFISRIVDMILPRTETPGALDVKVDMFIDRVVAKTNTESQQVEFKSNIAAFNESCQTDFGKDFLSLSEADQVAVLKKEEKSSGKFRGDVWGTSVGNQEKPISFYKSLKSMALWAYFSSEEIGKNTLSYDPIPGGYNGCLDIKVVGNKWSL